MIAVSACLVGKNTKYDGSNNKNEYVLKYLENKEYILICPEVAGLLKTPRDPSEIVNNKVFSNKGKNVTFNFKLGAYKTKRLITKYKVNTLILKENSPSCGVNSVYDGTFTSTKIKGKGMLLKLLKNKDIKIYSEKDIEEIIKNK